MKVFVVPIRGQFWGVPLNGSVVHSHPIACSGPDGWFSRFFDMLFPVGGQSANSTHGSHVWILAFVAFLTRHPRYTLESLDHFQ